MTAKKKLANDEPFTTPGTVVIVIRDAAGVVQHRGQADVADIDVLADDLSALIPGLPIYGGQYLDRDDDEVTG